MEPIADYCSDYSLSFFVISDPHLTYPAESEERLSEDAIPIFRDTLEDIEKAGADIIFFTGDILESREYGLKNLRIAIELMNRLTMPWFVLPGNHDLRYRSTLDSYDKNCFIKQFKGHGPNGEVAYWRHDYPNKKLAFIGLDSTLAGSGHGIIDRRQKEWLEDCLNEIDRNYNIIILTHHPVVLFDREIIDIKEMDVYLLRNHDEIRGVLEKYQNVMLVISGHNHTCRYLHINGIHYVGCPSINIWPTMYTKFAVDCEKIVFRYIPIRDYEKTDKSKRKLFSANSSIVNMFGSKEAAYDYYDRGPRSLEVRIL